MSIRLPSLQSHRQICRTPSHIQRFSALRPLRVHKRLHHHASFLGQACRSSKRTRSGIYWTGWFVLARKFLGCFYRICCGEIIAVDDFYCVEQVDVVIWSYVETRNCWQRRVRVTLRKIEDNHASLTSIWLRMKHVPGGELLDSFGIATSGVAF